MGLLKKFFCIIFLSAFLYGCCVIDYSSDLRKIGDEYKAEMNLYYEQNKYYPSTKEEKIILSKMGCEISSKSPPLYVCEGTEYLIDSHLFSPPSEGVSLRIVRSSSQCRYSFYNDNSTFSDKINCIQLPCIDLRQ